MPYPAEHPSSNTTSHSKLVKAAAYARFRLEKSAWRVNVLLSRLCGRLRGHASPDGEAFRRLPMHLGRLSEANLNALREAIAAAPIAPFSAADHAPGYVFNEGDDAIARIFNDGYRFRRLDAPQRRAIARALDELASEITRCLASGWRVINVKSWSIRSETVQLGPNAWHLDGFPVGTFKLMIYLTPIGKMHGTTEVKLGDGSSRILEGEAGTYLLFDPSVLLHRGIAPGAPAVERIHIEITLMVTPVTDRRLADGGLNSSYPRLPWARLPIWQA